MNVEQQIQKTMKKTYIQPRIAFYTIAVHHPFLNASTLEVKGGSYSEGMTDLSRGNSSWDDDEE